jgi:nicotinamidase-related amidase
VRRVRGLVDVEDSVLIVVDTQPGFLDKLENDATARLVERIAWLVRLARECRVPIVVTEEAPSKNGATANGVLRWLPDHLVRHEKPSFGLAACPPIMADLERHARRTAVLCGLETDVCVAQSAIGLAEGGWDVVVVSDAVASPGIAHAQGSERIRDVGVTMIGLKGLCYEWLRTVERTDAVDDALWRDAPTGIVF